MPYIGAGLTRFNTADELTVTGDAEFNGNANFGDTNKAVFGADSDFSIEHNGSKTKLSETGTGNLEVRGTNIDFLDGTGAEYYLQMVHNGAVTLYHDNASKLATTATGIDITGTAVTDGLTVAGNVSIDGGTIKLDGNYPTGSNNVALGDNTLDDGSLSGGNNTAVGSAALTDNTSGAQNTAIGSFAGTNLTTGGLNTAVGQNAMFTNTTGTNNVAVGQAALYSNTTAGNNTAVGKSALAANTTGTQNVAVGQNTADAVTTGNSNVAVGAHALGQTTTGSNNTAVGHNALTANTTASSNTAVGHNCLTANTTGTNNACFGRDAGERVTTGSQNTLIGDNAGENITTPSNNTFIGRSAGSLVTTGADNTIIGRYNGNQDGLDIRTASNRVVLSDGDGNVRQHMDDNGRVTWGQSGYSSHHGFLSLEWNAPSYVGFGMKNTNATTGGALFRFFNSTGGTVGQITTNNSVTSYSTSSDHRLKENISDMTGAITRVKSLKPKRFNFINDPSDTLVDGFLAHEAQTVVPEAVEGTHNEVDSDGNEVHQSIDQSKLVPLLTAALKEAITKIETLETKVAALEAE